MGQSPALQTGTVLLRVDDEGVQAWGAGVRTPTLQLGPRDVRQSQMQVPEPIRQRRETLPRPGQPHHHGEPLEGPTPAVTHRAE